MGKKDLFGIKLLVLALCPVNIISVTEKMLTGHTASTTVVYPFKWNNVFGNNIKSKMGILNIIRKMYFNQKTLAKNIFWKFVYVL